MNSASTQREREPHLHECRKTENMGPALSNGKLDDPDVYCVMNPSSQEVDLTTVIAGANSQVTIRVAVIRITVFGA